MIIVQLQGGLGNQFFQYAFGRALSTLRGTELLLDTSHFEGPQRQPEFAEFRRQVKLDQFQVDARWATAKDVARIRDRWRRIFPLLAATGFLRRRWWRLHFGHFRERGTNFDPRVLTLPDNVYVEGYFQSEQYFKALEPEIRAEFQPRDAALTAYAEGYVRDVRKGNGRVVSVHVRRGDLAKAEAINKRNIIYGPSMTADYFAKAIAQFDPSSTFLVFTETAEDQAWCRDNIRAPNLAFSSNHTDLQDFAIMRACDDHVIANSTFSWWAAWLNDRPDKHVVAPRSWFYRSYAPRHRMESLIPPTWQLI